MLCSNCAFQLRLSHGFKEQCHRSDIQLRSVVDSDIDKLILKTVSETPNIKVIAIEPSSLNDHTILQTEVVSATDFVAETTETRNENGNEKSVLKKEECDNDSDNFEIERLDYEDSDEEYVDYIKKTNSNGYECKECHKYFKNEENCQFHILKHKKVKKCLVCDQKFKCKLLNAV